ncbi:MAG TPA: hypothetical protein VHO25_19585, partial [Polyangiaceae bacterium]|nr:hypothetical protein [Polyangiaceae bacterium]
MFWDILSSVAITVLFAVGFGQGRARKAASGWLMTYPLLAKGVASLFSWGFLLLIALSSLNPANRTPRALT